MAKKKELVPMVNWVYDVILWAMSVLVDLFFREVHPRGSWKVPRRGPVIFVAAPHANQVSSILSYTPLVTHADHISLLTLSFLCESSKWRLEGALHGSSLRNP